MGISPVAIIVMAASDIPAAKVTVGTNDLVFNSEREQQKKEIPRESIIR